MGPFCTASLFTYKQHAALGSLMLCIAKALHNKMKNTWKQSLQKIRMGTLKINHNSAQIILRLVCVYPLDFLRGISFPLLQLALHKPTK